MIDFKIFIKDLKIMLASIKFYILVFLIIPLLTASLYGMMYEKILNPDTKLPEANVAFINNDEGSYADSLKDIFTSDRMREFIKLRVEKDYKDVENMLKKGEISTAIVIPKDFSRKINEGEKVDIEVLKAPSSGINSDIVYQVVNSYTDVLNNNAGISSVLKDNLNDKSKINEVMGDIVPKAIKLSTGNYTNAVNVESERVLTSKQFFMSSIFAFASLFICIIGVTSIIREREQGTLNRLKSTAVTYKSIYNAKIFLVFFIGICSNAAFILISSLLGVKWGENIFNLFITIFLHTFALTGVSAIFMNLFEKQDTADIVFSIASGVMVFLGGTFYPVDYIVPAKNIAKFTLNYWIQSSYNKVMLGRGIEEMTVNMIVLFVVGAVGIVIGKLITAYKTKLLV